MEKRNRTLKWTHIFFISCFVFVILHSVNKDVTKIKLENESRIQLHPYHGQKKTAKFNTELPQNKIIVEKDTSWRIELFNAWSNQDLEGQLDVMVNDWGGIMFYEIKLRESYLKC